MLPSRGLKEGTQDLMVSSDQKCSTVAPKQRSSWTANTRQIPGTAQWQHRRMATSLPMLRPRGAVLRIARELHIDGTRALTDRKIARGSERVRKDKGSSYVVRPDNSWATTKDQPESFLDNTPEDLGHANAAPLASSITHTRRQGSCEPANTLKLHQVRTIRSDESNRNINRTVIAALNVKCQNVQKADLTEHQLDQQNGKCMICRFNLFPKITEADSNSDNAAEKSSEDDDDIEPDQVVMLYPCKALFHNKCMGEYCIQEQDVDKARTVPNAYELEHRITPPSPMKPPADTKWTERKDRWVGVDNIGTTHTILKSKGNAVNCPTCKRPILPSGHDLDYENMQ